MSESAQNKNDRFFDGHYVPRTPALNYAIARIIAEVEQVEPKGKRKRRVEYQRTFEATITGVVCDLLRAVLEDDGRGIAISRSNRKLGTRDRYHSVVWNQRLPGVLDGLQTLGWLTQEIGERSPFGRHQRTLLYPADRLVALAEDLRLGFRDIRRHPGEEVIVLKSVSEGYWHKGERMPYDDTPETHRLRAEVRVINEWLEQADILFRYQDASDRTLRRHFTRGSFQSGGRLYGGFWQALSKDERLNQVRIGGEPVAYLDYGQVGPRILYGLESAPLPPGDLYDVPGISLAYRKGIKKVMGCLTFTEGLPSRKPKGSKALLPATMSIERVIALCAEAHPAISHHFGTSIGHTVQWIESEVMVRVMLTLIQDNIVGLPIHDGVIVPVSAWASARAIMAHVFEDIVGVVASVDVEPDRLVTDDSDMVDTTYIKRALSVCVAA